MWCACVSFGCWILALVLRKSWVRHCPSRLTLTFCHHQTPGSSTSSWRYVWASWPSSSTMYWTWSRRAPDAVSASPSRDPYLRRAHPASSSSTAPDVREEEASRCGRKEGAREWSAVRRDPSRAGRELHCSSTGANHCLSCPSALKEDPATAALASNSPPSPGDRPRSWLYHYRWCQLASSLLLSSQSPQRLHQQN